MRSETLPDSCTKQLLTDGNAQSEASDNPLGCDSVATTVVRTDAVTEEKIWQTKIGETIEREMYYSQDFSIVVTYGTAGAPLNITIYDDESNECGTIAEAKSSSASHRAELEAAAAQGGPALAATQPLVEDAEEDQGYVSG